MTPAKYGLRGVCHVMVNSPGVVGWLLCVAAASGGCSWGAMGGSAPMRNAINPENLQCASYSTVSHVYQNCQFSAIPHVPMLDNAYQVSESLSVSFSNG